jgi:hypothetical protein
MGGTGDAHLMTLPRSGNLSDYGGPGVSFIVFGWPAFWWLDYYSGLHRHLRSSSRCVVHNDCLVVFDLRP